MGDGGCKIVIVAKYFLSSLSICLLSFSSSPHHMLVIMLLVSVVTEPATLHI